MLAFILGLLVGFVLGHVVARMSDDDDDFGPRIVNQSGNYAGGDIVGGNKTTLAA